MTDRKKGAGSLITPAKTYNPSSDLVLGGTAEPSGEQKGSPSKKRKHEKVEPTSIGEALVQGNGEEKKEKKKKKKKVEVKRPEFENNDQVAVAAAAEEPEKKKKKMKKTDSQGTAVENQGQDDLPEAEQVLDPKEKKKKHTEADDKQEAEL